jgi:hypothetical protein
MNATAFALVALALACVIAPFTRPITIGKSMSDFAAIVVWVAYYGMPLAAACYLLTLAVGLVQP